MRAVLLALTIAMLAGGCSGDKAAPPAASGASSEETRKRNCADPKWKEENMGLWYSVCRQPVRW